jgi:hypothetical protein
LVGAVIDRRIAAFDDEHPYPEQVRHGWRRAREALQARGELPEGLQQVSPRGLQVFLDDYNGTGGLDPVPPPRDFPLIKFDAEQMRQLGLVPAALDSRIVAHASIAAGTIEEVGFKVAQPKTLIGPSIISLGLQTDVAAYSIICPDAKRRILTSQCTAVRAAISAAAGVDRVDTTRITGRLCNISQLFPEIGAELHGGYTVGSARARSGARRLLSHVPLTPTSPAGRAYDRLASVAVDVLATNNGIPLATAELFPPPGSPELATVIGDASGDIQGGDAGFGGVVHHPDAPRVAFTISVKWPADIAEALAQSALQPHLRSGGLRLSMPAAELFTSWACLEAALDAGGLRSCTRACIAVGDCQPAAAVLNRVSSPVPQLRSLLAGARSTLDQWLGVQVPRELNTLADILSHPSRVQEAYSKLRASGLLPVVADLPPGHRCWSILRAAVAASNPSDPDF